jgi:hypothetical protein
VCQCPWVHVYVYVPVHVLKAVCKSHTRTWT